MNCDEMCRFNPPTAVRLDTGVALDGHAEAHSQDDASHEDVCLHLRQGKTPQIGYATALICQPSRQKGGRLELFDASNG